MPELYRDQIPDAPESLMKKVGYSEEQVQELVDAAREVNNAIHDPSIQHKIDRLTTALQPWENK